MTTLQQALRACVEQNIPLDLFNSHGLGKRLAQQKNKAELLARLDVFARQFVADEDAAFERLEGRVSAYAAHIAKLTDERDALKVELEEQEAIKGELRRLLKEGAQTVMEARRQLAAGDAARAALREQIEGLVTMWRKRFDAGFNPDDLPDTLAYWDGVKRCSEELAKLLASSPPERTT